MGHPLVGGILLLGLLALPPPLVSPDALTQHMDELLVEAPVLAPGQLNQCGVQVGRQPQRIPDLALRARGNRQGGGC